MDYSDQDDMYLMHLPPSSLHLTCYNQVFDEDSDAPQRKQAEEEAEDATWRAQTAMQKVFCEYPPTSTSDVYYTVSDFAKFFNHLPLLATL